MPIPVLSQESPNLAIVDRCLIGTQEMSIGTNGIEIMWTLKSPDRHLLCTNQQSRDLAILGTKQI